MDEPHEYSLGGAKFAPTEEVVEMIASEPPSPEPPDLKDRWTAFPWMAIYSPPLQRLRRRPWKPPAVGDPEALPEGPRDLTSSAVRFKPGRGYDPEGRGRFRWRGKTYIELRLLPTAELEQERFSGLLARYGGAAGLRRHFADMWGHTPRDDADWALDDLSREELGLPAEARKKAT